MRRSGFAMVLITLGTVALASQARGQSSSLLVDTNVPESTVKKFQTDDGVVRRLAPALIDVSYSSVSLPESRTYGVNDLVTIIINETTNANFSSSLETSKESTFDGGITDLPKLSLGDLLKLNFRPDQLTDDIKLAIEYENEFAGDGDLQRKESITGRIQARVIDVKPNGTLVLEARKYNQVDKETLMMIITGTCRVEDITPSNTVLSNQLYDLHLVKTHTGDLARAAKKGVLTRVFEFLFNF